ncbi:MAG: hypothetical protein J5614_05305 [Paludibacteraceae bacterium]|nr:hypothetical protein [Paludibacteraceae bacterium]
MKRLINKSLPSISDMMCGIYINECGFTWYKQSIIAGIVIPSMSGSVLTNVEMNLPVEIIRVEYCSNSIDLSKDKRLLKVTLSENADTDWVQISYNDIINLWRRLGYLKKLNLVKPEVSDLNIPSELLYNDVEYIQVYASLQSKKDVELLKNALVSVADFARSQYLNNNPKRNETTQNEMNNAIGCKFMIELSDGEHHGFLVNTRIDEKERSKLYNNYKHNYFLRYGDDDSIPCTVEAPTVIVNCFGQFFTDDELVLDKTDTSGSKYAVIKDFSY